MSAAVTLRLELPASAKDVTGTAVWLNEITPGFADVGVPSFQPK